MFYLYGLLRQHTKQLEEVRQSYTAKYYSAKSKEVVDLASNNNTNEAEPPEKIIIIPTYENENATQKSKSAVHTWRIRTTLIVGDQLKESKKD